jgi:hypothetical protein
MEGSNGCLNSWVADKICDRGNFVTEPKPRPFHMASANRIG